MFAFLKHLLKESEIFGNINFLKYFLQISDLENLWFFDLYKILTGMRSIARASKTLNIMRMPTPAPIPTTQPRWYIYIY